MSEDLKMIRKRSQAALDSNPTESKQGASLWRLRQVWKQMMKGEVVVRVEIWRMGTLQHRLEMAKALGGAHADYEFDEDEHEDENAIQSTMNPMFISSTLRI